MIEIAKILKPHGIHGEVKVQLFSDNIEAFCERGFAYVTHGNKYRRINYTSVRISCPYVYLRLDGVNTRNDAEAYHGVFLYLDRKDFEEPDVGEYYICDLIGLGVVSEDGTKLGKLSEILQHGAADVYVVKGDNNFMFPALSRVIRKVDIENGILEVDAKALEEVAVYDV